MTDLLNTNWRLSDQAIANSVADETVILHLGNGTYFGLDPIGARLWASLDAGKPLSELCEDILNEYEVDHATLEQDLTALLRELADNELIIEG